MGQFKFTKAQRSRINQLKNEGLNNSEITDTIRAEFDLEKTMKWETLRSRVRRVLKKKGNSQQKSKTLEDSNEFKQARQRKYKKSKVYLLTWEQNATPLHDNFWNNLLTYKNFRKAELAVILGRYKNPTSVWKEGIHEHWNTKTQPYWDANTHDIHQYLTILSGAKIQPTAKYPLTGISGMSPGKSIVVGHPKQHMTTQPTLAGQPHKVLFTTGACTVPNYTDSKAGYIGANNHKLGFTVVEIRDDEIFHIRQVEADHNGNFVDLCYVVKNQKVSVTTKALGMVCGDTHYGHLDPVIDAANDQMCEYFNIDKLVLHDVPDGESMNNHILKSPTLQYLRYKEGKHDAIKELQDTTDWLRTKIKYGPIVPQANHNDRFDRALDNDWRKDIPNSMFYLKYTQAVLEGNAPKGVFAYFVEQQLGDQVKFLGYQDSYKIGKYECSQHGHHGANGSRGSVRGLRNLDIAMIDAHGHSAYRADDYFRAGTNTYLNLGYNERGPSSWIQANVLISENGLAQHIIFINGQYTTIDLLN